MPFLILVKYIFEDFPVFPQLCPVNLINLEVISRISANFIYLNTEILLNFSVEWKFRRKFCNKILRNMINIQIYSYETWHSSLISKDFLCLFK